MTKMVKCDRDLRNGGLMLAATFLAFGAYCVWVAGALGAPGDGGGLDHNGQAQSGQNGGNSGPLTRQELVDLSARIDHPITRDTQAAIMQQQMDETAALAYINNSRNEDSDMHYFLRTGSGGVCCLGGPLHPSNGNAGGASNSSGSNSSIGGAGANGNPLGAGGNSQNGGSV